MVLAVLLQIGAKDLTVHCTCPFTLHKSHLMVPLVGYKDLWRLLLLFLLVSYHLYTFSIVNIICFYSEYLKGLGKNIATLEVSI